MKEIILAVITSAVVSIAFGFLIIPALRSLKLGQPILKYVTKHKGKSGTPTMGGVIFIVPAVISYFIFTSGNMLLAGFVIAVTLAFMVVGFLDDFLKIKLKKNEGLTPTQKILFQTAISIIASVVAYRSGQVIFNLPFTKSSVYLGALSIALNTLVFVATVNAVNLTDGLDGLCASVSSVNLLFFGVLILLQLICS